MLRSRALASALRTRIKNRHNPPRKLPVTVPLLPRGRAGAIISAFARLAGKMLRADWGRYGNAGCLGGKENRDGGRRRDFQKTWFDCTRRRNVEQRQRR